MNIQQAAGASGLSPDTIRFYERTGVLPPPPREGNGYRRYTEEHLLTLRLAKGLRRLRVPLDEVASILKVAHDGTCGEVREAILTTLASVLTEIDTRLNELTSLRGQVSGIVSGVGSMNSGDDTVSGMKPCSCVRLLAAGQQESQVTR